ncbi:MAG: hypothetical protein WC492_04255 [Candidatus Micrarchaeia archaeon]
MKKALFFGFVLMALVLPAFCSDTFTYIRDYNISGGLAGTVFNFTQPTAVVMGDDKLLYVSDIGRGGVYAINTTTDKAVKRIGDLGEDKLSTPVGMQFVNGRLYIADRTRKEIYDYYQYSLFSAGPLKALMGEPAAVYVENGTMYILDRQKNFVLVYDMQKREITNQYLQAGTGSGKISGAEDMKFYGGRFYIADTINNRVQIFEKDFTYVGTVGTGKGGISLTSPKGVFTDGKIIYASDWGNNRVVAFDMDGNVLDTFGGKGYGKYNFTNPSGIFVDGDILYVVDNGNRRVVAYSINWSANEQGVRADIDSANAAVSDYKTGTIAFLNALGVEYKPFDADADIANAYRYYDEGETAKAKDSAAVALTKIDARKNIDTQLIEATLQQKIDSQKEKIGILASIGLDNAGKIQLNNASAYVANARTALAGKDYQQCFLNINKSTEVLNTITGNVQSAQEQENQQTNQAQEQADAKKLLVKARAAEIEIDLANLQKKANEMNISVSFELAKTLITTSDELATLGEYDSALDTLAKAKQNLQDTNVELDGKQKITQAAIQNITIYRVQIELLLGKNADKNSPAMTEMAKADALVYQNPEQAIKTAQAALEYAKIQKAQTDQYALAIAVVGALFLAVIVLAGVAYMMIRKRGPANPAHSHRKDEKDVEIPQASSDANKGRKR